MYQDRNFDYNQGDREFHQGLKHRNYYHNNGHHNRNNYRQQNLDQGKTNRNFYNYNREKRSSNQYQDQENPTQIEFQKNQKISQRTEEQQNQVYDFNNLPSRSSVNNISLNPKDHQHLKKYPQAATFPIQYFPQTQSNIPNSGNNYPINQAFFQQSITNNYQNPAYFDPSSSASLSESSLDSSYISCSNNPQQIPLSMFTTPKLDSQQNHLGLSHNHSQPHQLSINCLRKCATWSLALKYNNQKATKIHQSAIAHRQNGSLQNGPCQFTQDIIDAFIEKETANQCSQVPILMNQVQHLREFNGFHMNNSSDKVQQIPLTLPLNNTDNEIYSQCTDILKNYMSEQMICVEFDLQEIPLVPSFLADPIYQENQQQQQSDINPRIINQQLVESTLHYYVNGFCHGQKILIQDLHFQLQGKKIIKSIQQRILDYKEYVSKKIQNKLQQLSHYSCKCKMQGYKCNHQQFNGQNQLTNNLRQNLNYLRQLNYHNQGPYLQRSDSLHCKMVNITKSIGIQFQFDNLPNIESFLTNFNQIVLQEGIINKIMFCFNLPISKMLKSITQQDLDPQSYIVTPIKHLIFKDQTNTFGKDTDEESKSNLKGSNYKPFNLLEEFQKIRVPSVDDNKQLNQIIEEPSLIERSQSSASNSTQTSNADQNQFNLQNSTISNSNLILNQINYSQNLYQLQYQQNVIQQQQKNVNVYPYQMIPQNLMSNLGNYELQRQQLLISNQRIQLPDVHYKSNLDIMLDSFQPQYLKNQSLKQLFLQYLEASTFGAKLLLHNGSSEFPEIVTFVPTLSSLYLSYYEKQSNNEMEAISEFTLGEAVNQDQKSPKQKQQINKGARRLKVYEYHEVVPNYMREPLGMQIEQIFQQHPHLQDLVLDQDFNCRQSWFSVAWTPIKQHSLNKEKCPSQSLNLTQQFLIIYGLAPCLADPNKVQMIGCIPFKEEEVQYWIKPIPLDDILLTQQIPQIQYHLQNNLRREYNRNRDKLIDLKERAIEFMEIENQKTYDYNFFVNSMNLFYDTQ